LSTVDALPPVLEPALGLAATLVLEVSPVNQPSRAPKPTKALPTRRKIAATIERVRCC
jgi:hypothetical protein